VISNCHGKTIFTNLKKRFEQIELPAKLLDYFLRSNKSNINQSWHNPYLWPWVHYTTPILGNQVNGKKRRPQAPSQLRAPVLLNGRGGGWYQDQRKESVCVSLCLCLCVCASSICEITRATSQWRVHLCLMAPRTWSMCRANRDSSKANRLFLME